MRIKLISITLTGMLLAIIAVPSASAGSNGTLKPYTENGWYWEYKGEPIMLIGASDKDNIFQWTGEQLTNHLDLMRSVGGNYVRNTMSDRKEGDIFAVKQLDSGLYDLSQWNEDYWKKLQFFLEETHKREIIVQLTLWDWFDLSGGDIYGRFAIHPLNPQNNINFEPGTIENAADFYGGSLRDNNHPVLEYQHQFIDRLMSIALQYDHVLYNINNESSVGADWENYWALYITSASVEAGTDIHITNMQLVPDLSVRHVLTYSDIYSFVDVSQNNQDAKGAVGRKHWENLIYWREMIGAGKNGPMPINNEKIYGQSIGVNTLAGTEKEAIERFWRNIFGGAASVRFHRPAMRDGGRWGWGIGLSESAQQTLTAASMFIKEFDLFSSKPFMGVETVGRTIDADYSLANIGKEYAVYFPGGRASVHLDPWFYAKKVSVRWLNLVTLSWSDEEIVEPRWDQYDGLDWWGPQRIITLTPPTHRASIGLVKVIE